MGEEVKYQVRLTPRAARQAYKAKEYYSQISQELGDQFQNELKIRLRKLEVFALFEIKYDNVRKVWLNGFPYTLHIRVFEDERLVQVIGIYHHHQKQS